MILWQEPPEWEAFRKPRASGDDPPYFIEWKISPS